MNAVCIGCGCRDDDACDPPCHWLRVDRDFGLGVCSSCPEFEAEFVAGSMGSASIDPPLESPFQDVGEIA